MTVHPVRALVLATAVALATGACAGRTASSDEHADHAATPSASGAAGTSTQGAQTAGIPASNREVQQRLAASTRHGEYQMIRTGPNDSVRAWVVYPERRSKAPVVVVIHEIYGLQHWIRGVADQLAADGFIAIAPDLMTGKISPATADSAPNVATAAIRTLDKATVHRQLAAVGQWGTRLAAAEPRYGVVGFCWGGSESFMHAVMSPDRLRAAVVYYGSSPKPDTLRFVKVPVLGLYGGNDARVNATVPAADTAMRALGKSFTFRMFEGAGHGFLRQQQDSTGAWMTANHNAALEAWPMTVAFFRRHLGA
jgi:carboxymethylenebutenolidase